MKERCYNKTTEIQKIIRDYFENCYAMKGENLKEINKF